LNRKIVLPGGSGFIGRALAQAFAAAGWEVVILSRAPAPPQGTIRTAAWDGRTAGAWAAELEGAEAVINLAGRSIGCVHTPENRRQILESRVESVRAINAAVAQCLRPPPVLIQASAIGIYGNTGDRICDETSPAAADFLAQVVVTWEAAFFGEKGTGGPRRVALRQGHVLGRNGGFLPPLARLTRLFLGGATGRGGDYLSWLHIADYCALCQWVIAHPECQGVYNAAAPSPATNAEFMRELRKVRRRPWSPPVPAWIVKLTARFVLGVDPSLVVGGCRAVPRHLLAEGFVFRYPDLGGALRDLFRPAGVDKPPNHFHA
jgi:uncharacterized protein (TIGR01777 family)